MPGYAADGFEKVAEGQVYARALQAERKTGREASVAAHRTILGKTTMFSPQLLVDAGMCSLLCSAVCALGSRLQAEAYCNIVIAHHHMRGQYHWETCAERHSNRLRALTRVNIALLRASGFLMQA